MLKGIEIPMLGECRCEMQWFGISEVLMSNKDYVEDATIDSREEKIEAVCKVSRNG